MGRCPGTSACSQTTCSQTTLFQTNGQARSEGSHRKLAFLDSAEAFLDFAEKGKQAQLQDRPTYGNPLDFRGLSREPVNEQGVVLLFGMVAKELGYMVEAVQTGFPDCEAKRQIAPERWQRVRIEFEFESRKFREHGHPSTGCDVIVCWRHNWDQCPEQVEIVELSSVIKSLATSED